MNIRFFIYVDLLSFTIICPRRHNVVQVDPVNPIDCFPTGSAKVPQITIGGNPIIDPMRLDADSDYEWYKNDFPTNSLPGETLTALNNQLPDRYYVSSMRIFTSGTRTMLLRRT